MAAASKHLAPIGVRQRGRSRIWIDDHGWWLVLIEFQPSSWDKGSYLNVGAMWLWHEADSLTFNDGYRVADFVSAKTPEQFSSHTELLAVEAKEQVLLYRARYSCVADVARVLLAKKQRGFWDSYHAAIACSLSGHTDSALRLYEEFAALGGSRDWEKAAQATAREYSALLQDASAFRSRLTEVVKRTRSRLKLHEHRDHGLAPSPDGPLG
jgi:hypothetical protein